MTTKLAIYNSALGLIGDRKLSSLSENVESRRALDSVWDSGLVRYCLEQGLWNFAMRTRQGDYSPSESPPFGYAYAYVKPTDWVRTAAVCTDEHFTTPITRYVDEAGYWFCEHPQIYLMYVSDNKDYGGDLSLWPETFKRYVEAYLAAEAVERISGNDTKQDQLLKLTKRRLGDARSKDAMNQPAQFPHLNSWNRARLGNSNRYDRAGHRFT